MIGTAGTEEGMQAVMQNGASKALNHRQPGYLDELKASTMLPIYDSCEVNKSIILRLVLKKSYT